LGVFSFPAETIPQKKQIPNYESGSLDVIINQFKRAVTMEIK